MSDIFVDKLTNDIRITGGDIVFTSDISFEEVMLQKIRALLNTFEGEYYKDDVNNPQIGVPYYQKIFTNNIPTAKLADNVFRQALLSVDGVSSVEELAFSINSRTRELIVRFKVKISSQTTTTTVQDEILLGAVNQ